MSIVGNDDGDDNDDGNDNDDSDDSSDDDNQWEIYNYYLGCDVNKRCFVMVMCYVIFHFKTHPNLDLTTIHCTKTCYIQPDTILYLANTFFFKGHFQVSLNNQQTAF